MSEHKPVGFLLRGKFLCPTCAFPQRGNLVPVYRVNIGIYSQQCASCKTLVVDGVKKADGSPLNLFEEERP